MQGAGRVRDQTCNQTLITYPVRGSSHCDRLRLWSRKYTSPCGVRRISQPFGSGSSVIGPGRALWPRSARPGELLSTEVALVRFPL